jgi:hypothetical protein
MLPKEALPFAQSHEGCASRYAGLFILFFPLLTQWRWLDKIFACFGWVFRPKSTTDSAVNRPPIPAQIVH